MTTEELREEIDKLIPYDPLLPSETPDVVTKKILKACQKAGLAFGVGEGISIGTSCGRSTDYVDEWWIEDEKGNKINPSDWQQDRVKYRQTEEIEQK